MGLLDFLKKKPEAPKETAAEPAPQEDMMVYSHMRVEVTGLDGRLLFVAKLMNPRGTTAELHQYSELEPPKDEEPIRVRIRGYHDRLRKAVYMEGVITPKPNRVWQVEELTVARIGNDRAFFRLEMDVDATATSFHGINAGEKPCKLKDVSVGGARIAAKQQYWEGDKFLLNVRLLEDREPSIMFCQVLRVIEKEDSSYEYGCQFLELNEADEGKITQNIFDAQRRRRGTSR